MALAIYRAKQNPHNANLIVVIPEVPFAYAMSAGNIYLSACHGSYKAPTQYRGISHDVITLKNTEI